MVNSLITGVGGIVFLMIGWIVVQSFWGKIFSEHLIDEDVMAGRTKCSNCGCTSSVCKNKAPELSTK